MARRMFLLFSFVAVVLSTLLCSASDDIAKFGGPVEVKQGESVGDIAQFGGPLTVDGDVTGDIAVFGGPVTINGKVHGDVAVFGGPVILGEHSTVGGDLAAFGGPLHRAPGAVVNGDVANPHAFGVFVGGLMLLFAVGLLALIPLGVVFALLGYAILRDRRINVMVAETEHDSGTVVLAGIGALAATVAISVLTLKAHLVHFPLRGVLLLLFCVTLFVGYTGVSAWVGRRIARSSGPLAMVLIGALIISVVQAIPVVGLFAFFVFMFLALGMAVTTGYGTAQGWLRRVA
jgi:hypothetical protein